MKTKPTSLFSAVWLALALALLPALRAQQQTPPAAPAPAEQAAATKQVAPADQTASADKSADAEKPAPPAEAAKPAADETKPAADDKKVAADKAGETAAEPPKTEAPDTKAKSRHAVRVDKFNRNSGNERVSFGHDSTLAAGEQADTVVSIMGSSTSAGEVGDAVVSVFGNTRVTGGTVGDAAVAVLGNTYVNSHVRGEVVAVLGNVELGPEAVVDGEVVCVGGEVTRDAKASVHGNVQNIGIGGRHFNFTGLQTWFTQCVLYARPLAFNADVMWAWWIALAFLGFYVLLALVAPSGVSKCVATLEERPGYSILSGVLTLLLTPVGYLLLVLTLVIAIGFVLIPLFSMGLFFAAIFGKVVMLAWLGRRLTKYFGEGPLAHPALAVLIGGLIVLGLYTVPILGFIVYKLLGILGLGVVVYTLIRMFKASRPAKPAVVAAGAPASPAGATAVTPDAGGAVPPLVAAAAVPTLPPVISAATLPRAGFWIRLCAVLLDLILIAILIAMLNSLFHWIHAGLPVWFAVYHVVMWATKGTTIGGIICSLRVVRLDDRRVDWGVAIVRALSAFLSLAVAGLGFIWVAFDDEKQSWHDKIAGTTIVQVPRGTPLL